MINYINKDTKIFVSVSKNPGNTGSMLHNYGYILNKINAIYIPIECKNEKDLINKSILFYGYGSGSTSTLFAGNIRNNAFNINKLDKYLEKRDSINFDQLKNIHERHTNMKNDSNFVNGLDKCKGVYYLTEYDNKSNVRKYKLF